MGLLKTLVKLAAIGLIVIGVIILAVGLYGLAGGSGVTFTINDRLVSAQEGGQIFSIIGIVMLLAGVLLGYFGFKRMQ